MTQQTHSADDAATPQRVRAVFASVVNVKKVRSLGVVRIEIELPAEMFTNAAQFDDKQVLVVPMSLPDTPYGIIEMDAPQVPPQKNEPAKPPKARGGLGRLGDNIDPVKWLGARCTEGQFQDWLGVRNEAEAIEKVRDICQVESRREIASDGAARERFLRDIFRPYTEAAARGFAAPGQETR